MSPQLNDGNIRKGLRSLRDLTQHLTTRADDSHAPPVFRFPRRTLKHLCLIPKMSNAGKVPRVASELNHAPPLVRVPVNSFEFHTCVRTPQADYLSRLLGR